MFKMMDLKCLKWWFSSIKPLLKSVIAILRNDDVMTYVTRTHSVTVHQQNKHLLTNKHAGHLDIKISKNNQQAISGYWTDHLDGQSMCLTNQVHIIWRRDRMLALYISWTRSSMDFNSLFLLRNHEDSLLHHLCGGGGPAGSFE